MLKNPRAAPGTNVGVRLAVARGQILFSLDETAQASYFVDEGVLLVSQFSRQGREVITSVYFPGEVCGGFAVMTESSHNGTGRASHKSPAVVSVIRRSELMDLVRNTPSFYEKLLSTQREKESFKDKMLLGVIANTCEQRVASSLLWLARKTAESSRPSQSFPLSRRELADFVGTTMETVIRVLSSFRKRGMVREFDGHLEINISALMSLESE